MRSNYWGISIVPPNEVPKTATPESFVASALEMEKTWHSALAETAYAATLERWPGNLPAQVGLGNTRYALGNFIGSEQAFRQVTLDHPDAIIGWNNLAEVLAELQRLPEALSAAEHAASLDGPNKVAAQETLNSIRKKLATQALQQ